MKSYALVTGASRGIGRAVSLQLAKDGRPLVLLSSRDRAGLEETAETAKAALQSPDVITALCDVSDSAQVEKLFKDLSARGIGHPAAHSATISVLVNNAGISHFDLVQDMSDADWNRVIGVNLSGVFYMCRKIVPMMVGCQAGNIINISSYWGICGASMESAYCASKGGVNAFTLSLARELAPSGIFVNAIAPEFVDTAMNAHLTSEEEADAIALMPSRRKYLPDDIAQMVLRILRADPAVTGRILLAGDDL